MASGLETVASAFGVVSLAIQLFQGCVEGYKICNTARNIGRDGDLLYTKLAVQRSRLEAWARKAGLPSGPFKRLHWDPIILILGQQQGLLRSAKELQDRYGLSGLAARTQKQDSVDKKIQLHEGHGSPTDTTGLVERLRPIFLGNQTARKDEAETIRKSNGVVNRFSWALVDKSKLKHIVNEITTLNSQLVEYLNDADQESFRKEVGTLYRALVAECKATEELDNIRQSMSPDASSSIVAAAHVKKLRLALKFDKRENEVAPVVVEPLASASEFKHFHSEKLVVGMETEYQGMRITTYNHTVVMVEWRTISAHWEAVHQSLHDLAVLLHQASDSTFHALKCAGYVDMQKPGRFGFVYDITDFAIGGDATSVQDQSLFELIPQCRFVSLVDRVRIACDIAEAVVQLHTAGWLHKGICSENVRFVTARRSKPRASITGHPYLVGYGYARPDTISAAVTTELPVTATDRDLYRHPNARGEARQSFQARFDMYGLACVLVELAVWKRLEDILQVHGSHDGLQAARQPLPSLNELFGDSNFQDELSFHVGPKYIGAIEMCLSASSEEGGMVESGVLEALRSCQA